MVRNQLSNTSSKNFIPDSTRFASASSTPSTTPSSIDSVRSTPNDSTEDASDLRNRPVKRYKRAGSFIGAGTAAYRYSSGPSSQHRVHYNPEQEDVTFKENEYKSQPRNLNKSRGAVQVFAPAFLAPPGPTQSQHPKTVSSGQDEKNGNTARHARNGRAATTLSSTSVTATATDRKTSSKSKSALKTEPVVLEFIADDRQFPVHQQWPQPKPLPKRSGVEVKEVVPAPESEAPAPGEHLSLEKHADRIAAMIAQKRRDNEANMMRHHLLQKQLQHQGIAKSAVEDVKNQSLDGTARDSKICSSDDSRVESGRRASSASTELSQLSDPTVEPTELDTNVQEQLIDQTQSPEIHNVPFAFPEHSDDQDYEFQDQTQRVSFRTPLQTQTMESQVVPLDDQLRGQHPVPSSTIFETVSQRTQASGRPLYTSINSATIQYAGVSVGSQMIDFANQMVDTGSTMSSVNLPQSANSISKHPTYNARQYWAPSWQADIQQAISQVSPGLAPQSQFMPVYSNNLDGYQHSEAFSRISPVESSTNTNNHSSFYKVKPGMWYGAHHPVLPGSGTQTDPRHPFTHRSPSSVASENQSTPSHTPPRLLQPPVLASNMNMFNGNVRESVASGSGAGAIGSTRKNMFRSNNAGGMSGRDSTR